MSLEQARKIAEKIFPLSTGVPELDRFFQYEPQTLHLLFGEAGAGKTTLGFTYPSVLIHKKIKEIAPELIKNGVVKYVIIDCDGGYDPERHQQIAEAHGVNFSELEACIMRRTPTSFTELHNILQGEYSHAKRKRIGGLEEELRESGGFPMTICIDAHTCFYRNDLLNAPLEHRAQVIMDRQPKLERHLIDLRAMAVDYNIPVISISWPVSTLGRAFMEDQISKLEKQVAEIRSSGGDPSLLEQKLLNLKEQFKAPFIGGRPFYMWPKSIIELKVPDVYTNERVAVSVKIRSRPSNLRARFKLTQAGIEPA